MNWLHPAFMGAAGLIALPVVLHFLRRKPQQSIHFPSLRFLGPEAVRETNKHRLRRLITLLLRCLIIAILAGAFARPFWLTSRAAGGNAVIVAVDNSYSMQVNGRWNSMLEWAGNQLADLDAGDQAAILLMNPSPRWLVPMTDNITHVRETLAGLQPGFFTTKYDPALRLAGQTLEHVAAKNRTIVWMGDGQRLGWAGVNFTHPLPPGVGIEFAPAPAAVRNQAAITGAQISSRSGGEVLTATVRLFTPSTETRTLTVSSGGKILATQKIELSADKLATVNVPLKLSGEAGVKAALDPDDLPADDFAYATFSAAKPLEILLADESPQPGEADFLAHAIDAVKTPDLQPLHYSPLPKDRWPLDAVALLRGGQSFQSPYVERLDEFLAGGGRAWLWVDGDADQLAWLKKQQIEAQPLPDADEGHHLRDLDLEHPLFALAGQKSLLPLLAVEFHSAWNLNSPRMDALAQWEQPGAALCEVPVGRGELFLCGFADSHAASTWPLQSSFVPFVHQAAVWLAQARQRAQAWKVGDAISLPPGRGEWASVDSPRMQQQTDAQQIVTPDAPGIYRFKTNTGTTLFAVNLSTEESDPSLWPTPDDLQKLVSKEAARAVERGAMPGISAQEAERQQKLWWWLVAAVVIFAVTELAVANRTAL
jgi:hypothetical protein